MTLELDRLAPVGGLQTEVLEMVERVRPGVVQVRSEGRGIGAGVVWSADGEIITNQHVVADERARKVTVVLEDGREFAATITAGNPGLDLALLKIQATDLVPVPVADSSHLRVGELVFAIGHPWGIRSVVTAGIISGLGETRVQGSRSGRTAQYIRSDVRLAPGNSGGPLLNPQGAVVGINAMIFGGDLGIAIPSHVVQGWLEGLARPRPGQVRLGVGVRPVRLTILEGESLGPVQGVGLRIVSVGPEGLAALNGFQVGDILLEVSQTRLHSAEELAELLAKLEPGRPFTVRFLRGDSVQTLTIGSGEVEQAA